MKKTFNALVYQEWDKFVAQCLEFDVASFGDTHDHALTMLTEAVELSYEDSNIPLSISHARVAQFDLNHA